MERYSLFWKKVQFFSALASFMAFWLDQLHCQSRIRFSLQHLLKRAGKKAHLKKEQEWKYLSNFYPSSFNRNKPEWSFSIMKKVDMIICWHCDEKKNCRMLWENFCNVDSSFWQCLSLSLTFIIMKPFKTQVTVIELTVNSSFTRLYTMGKHFFQGVFLYLCTYIFIK